MLDMIVSECQSSLAGAHPYPGGLLREQAEKGNWGGGGWRVARRSCARALGALRLGMYAKLTSVDLLGLFFLS